jgi:hypothetical protein
VTRPKLGRHTLDPRQRRLLREYAYSVRDGHTIPADVRAELAAAMERAGAPNAQDARRQAAADKRYVAALRGGKRGAPTRAEDALKLYAPRVKKK